MQGADIRPEWAACFRNSTPPPGILMEGRWYASLAFRAERWTGYYLWYILEAVVSD